MSHDVRDYMSDSFYSSLAGNVKKAENDQKKVVKTASDESTAKLPVRPVKEKK